MTTNYDQAIRHLETCLAQILEYAPDNEWIMHGNQSVSVAELKEFIATAQHGEMSETQMDTVYGLVDADAEQESKHYPHDIPRFKPEWVDVPWSLAVQCTFVPGRLQQEFADGVAVMANEIFRVFAGDGSEACDAGACKAIGAVMPDVFQEMKKIDKEVE